MTNISLLTNELNALIDGELDEARAREVGAQLEGDLGLKDLVTRCRDDRDRLRQIYGPLIDQPLPDSIKRLLTLPTPVQPKKRWLPIAAMIAATIALGFIGWFSLAYIARDSSDSLIAEAMAVRAGARAPEIQIAASMVSGDAMDELVARNFSTVARAPDLTKAGYHLTEMHVYRDGAKRRSLELSYRNSDNHIFTVYLTRPAEPQGFALIERGAIRICIWKNDDLSAVMVGEMSSDEMLRISSLTYADLNF